MTDKTNPEKKHSVPAKDKFVEGVDFYFENGMMVLTAHFLKKRGYCCGNGCRHCPYENSKKDPL